MNMLMDNVATQMQRIELAARAAAAEGKKPADDCPYPYGTPEALHWIACWILAGGVMP